MKTETKNKLGITPGEITGALSIIEEWMPTMIAHLPANFRHKASQQIPDIGLLIERIDSEFETGKTPRQLAEENKMMINTIKRVIPFIGNRQTISDGTNSISASELLAIIRKAEAK